MKVNETSTNITKVKDFSNTHVRMYIRIGVEFLQYNFFFLMVKFVNKGEMQIVETCKFELKLKLINT